MSTARHSKLSPLAATEHAWHACLSAGASRLGLLAVLVVSVTGVIPANGSK